MTTTLLTDADHLCALHRDCLLTDLLGQLDSSDLSPESVVTMRRSVGRWVNRCADGSGHE